MAGPERPFARTPEPPYVAVVFTSRRTGDDEQAYRAMAGEMARLAAGQPGYLGHESARDADGFGITVSYWTDEAAVRAWKRHPDHLEARAQGRASWYEAFEVRVATVTRAYGFGR